ncbi:MAG: waaE 3, partial [Bacteriovoracaceae bacterium]|nr:waaE 3 [Bacteriovoracaceae bacterium]
MPLTWPSLKLDSMALATLSVCYIVKNEEMLLEASLRSIETLAEEIIVVDTGSTDSTLQIAKKFSDRVESFKWCDDFSAARNFCASLAKSDWILFIDGDEILEENGEKEIRETIEAGKDISAFGVLQRNYTNDRSYPGWKPLPTEMDKNISGFLKGISGFADNFMMKLYRNHLGIVWEGVVHETIVGSCRKLGLQHLEIPACILHHLNELKTEPFRNEKKSYYLKLA